MNRTEILRSRHDRKTRRKLANRLAREIRLGKVEMTRGSIHELPGELECWDCGERGRMFFVSFWQPRSADGRLGDILETPRRCGMCSLKFLTQD